MLIGLIIGILIGYFITRYQLSEQKRAFDEQQAKSEAIVAQAVTGAKALAALIDEEQQINEQKAKLFNEAISIAREAIEVIPEPKKAPLKRLLTNLIDGWYVINDN